ncbi:MAG: rane protein, partial [Acidobacteria bacterium]|nr:rane protein [Acidobacteriota bacterium]
MPVRQGSGHPEQSRGVPRAAQALGAGASAQAAFAAYLVLTLVATWPLARNLGRNVAWDLGDSVLNMWILAWDCEQIRRILGGDVSRIAAFFDANIFYPAPLTLAYSDHLIAQALQICPVYVASGNPILAYNLLFLSTFVLSGLGMY